MKTAKLIAKNALFLSAGKGLGDLCTFIFLIYFARYFGADFVGKYGFSMSVGGFLTVLINLGLNALMVREVSKDKAKNATYAGNLLITQAVLAALIWLLIVLIAFVLNMNSDTKIILVLIGTYQVFYKLSVHFDAEFRAHEEMQYSAVLEMSHKMLILVLGLGSIHLWENPIMALAVYPISGVARFILGWVLSVSKYGWPHFEVDYPFIEEMVVKSMPFFFITLLGQFYDRLGIILLTLLQGESASGVYLPADRLLVSVGVGLSMLGTAIFPAMSRLSHKSGREFYKLYERSMRLIVTLALPAAALVFIVSEPIMVNLFGAGFVESVSVLKILSWGLLLAGVNIMMNSLIIVKNHEKVWVRMQLFVCLVYSAACLILIPLYSYMGLAYAKLMTQVLFAVMAYGYIRKNIHQSDMVKVTTGPVLSCIAAVGCYYLMGELTQWITIPVVLVVLILSVFIFKAVQFHDLFFLKNILMNSDRSAEEDEVEQVYVEKSVP